MEIFFGIIIGFTLFGLTSLATLFAFACAVLSGYRPLEKGILAALADFFLFG
ncbi:MAG: hypothetical protein MI799_08565 [Desulfobacterales bacterium]|nr:hypothetical protein [Desulfobacterales bacterium]